MSIDLAVALGILAGHGSATAFWSLWTSGERIDWRAPAAGAVVTVVAVALILALI